MRTGSLLSKPTQQVLSEWLHQRVIQWPFRTQGILLHHVRRLQGVLTIRDGVRESDISP